MPLVGSLVDVRLRADRPGQRPRNCAARFCEESRGAFLLVLRSGAQSEIGGFEGETFALARLHSLVDGVERISDGERRVGDDLIQDCFRTRDQIDGWDDLVDEPDAVGLLGADHSSRTE